MKRNIHVTNQFNKRHLQGYDIVALDNMNTIVNYSVDSLVCTALEYVDEQKCETVLSSLLEKIRANGSITLIFMDTKDLISNYSNQKTKTSDLFLALNNKKNLLTLDKVIMMLNKYSFIVSKIDRDNKDVVLIAHKQNNDR